MDKKESRKQSIQWIKQLFELSGWKVELFNSKLKLSRNGISKECLIKDRSISKQDFLKYSSEGFIIEKEDWNYNTYYINTFNIEDEKVLMMFDLSKVSPNWIIKRLPQRTFSKTRNEVNKEVTFLRSEDAIISRYESGRWIETSYQDLKKHLTIKREELSYSLF